MNRLPLLLTMVLFLPGLLVFGVSREVLEVRRKVLTQKLKNLDRDYWQEKQRVFQEKERYKTKTELLERKTTSLYAKNNSLVEELYLIKENVKKNEEEFKGLEERLSLFKGQIAETLEKEEQRVSQMYPHSVNPSILKLSAIKKFMTAGKTKAAMDAYFDYKTELIADGERVEISTGVVGDKATGDISTAQKLRLGYVGYIARTDKDTRMLIKKSTLKGIFYTWLSDGIPGRARTFLRAAVDHGFTNAGKKGAIIDIPLDVSQAGLKLKQFVSASSTGFFTAAYNYFSKGGIVMYPLFLILGMAIFIISERAVRYYQNHGKVDAFMEEVITLFFAGKREEALEKCRRLNSPVFRVVLPIIEQHAADRKTAERIIEEMSITEVAQLEKRLPTLGVLGMIAPLLGLLGTVSGMINLFDTITLFGTGNPKILAGGISEALITTFAGLTIAIPVIFAHHILTRFKQHILQDMEKQSIRMLNSFSENLSA